MPRPGLEFVTSNQNTAYPFHEDAKGLARLGSAPSHGSNAVLPMDFLVDAAFAVPATSTVVYLASIVLTEYGAYRMTFVDAASTVIGYGDWYPLGSRVVAINSESYAAGKVLMGDGAAAYCAGTTNDTFGQTLPLESCVAEPLAERVNSIWFTDGVYVYALDGDVTLVPGYNMALSTQPGTSTDQTVLTLSAIAGAGQGVVPAEDRTVTRIVNPMDLLPDKLGGIRIVGDDCYSIDPLGGAGTVADPYQFRISGGCYACCSCDDYVAMGLALKGLIDRAQALHTRLDATHVHYSADLADYNLYIASVRRVTGEVKAVRGSGSSGGMLNVSINVVNKSLADASAVTVTCTLASGSVIPAVISGTYRVSDGTVGVCDTVFTLPTSLPFGGSLSMTLALRLPTSAGIGALPLTVTLSTATQSVSTIYSGNVEFQAYPVAMIISIDPGAHPDVSGRYYKAGDFNGVPYYVRTDGSWYVWYFNSDHNYFISAVLGLALDYANAYEGGTRGNPFAAYDNNNYSGEAYVSPA